MIQVSRYLQELNRYATIHWLNNDAPVLDYANAMGHGAARLNPPAPRTTPPAAG